VLPRPRPLQRIADAFQAHPIAAVLGPRQCGKTTLARAFFAGHRGTYLDLEDPVDRQRLAAPMTALERLEGLIVIDEVQRQPELFELLRLLVDRPGNRVRFLILGSASPGLVKGASESLAGRVGFVDLGGFSIHEVGVEQSETLWGRGGFPRSYLAADDGTSFTWRRDFVRTFLERDIPQLGIAIPAETLRRFWTMIAHYHAQVWNGAEFARSLGVSENTVRRYLDILAGAFMVRVLPPWFENLKKRQVKAPKIYLRDSGLLHTLLQLQDLHEVRGHPKLGASWEGFALEQTIDALESRDTYFWATHGGAELDLMLLHGGKRYGFEFKYADAPRMTRSLGIARDDLGLERVFVVYPGDERYELASRVSAVSLADVAEVLRT
jgi:predicted AAA+ superfamily ATPase